MSTDVFSHGGTVNCPECKPYVAKNGRVWYQPLKVIHTNYGGHGFDIGECQKCGKAWRVSFVEKLDRAPSFDSQPGVDV